MLPAGFDNRPFNFWGRMFRITGEHDLVLEDLPLAAEENALGDDELKPRPPLPRVLVGHRVCSMGHSASWWLVRNSSVR